MNPPKISVVTVCYNAVNSIEKTILSVITQTYQNIEYIIIDGASTDGTIDVVKKYREQIAYFVSEPDKGIYDAMNKGIMAATGDWINFMNSGDSFASAYTLSDVFKKFTEYDDISVLYGDMRCCYSGSPLVIKPKPLSTLNYRMAFCHQSSFVRSAVLKECGFNLKYRYVADYALFHNLYFSGKRFHYLPIVVSDYYPEGGFTNTNILHVMYEEGEVSAKRDGVWLKHYIYTYISFLLHKILPVKLLNFLRASIINIRCSLIIY